MQTVFLYNAKSIQHKQFCTKRQAYLTRLNIKDYLLTYVVQTYLSTKLSLSTFITFITVGTVVSRFKQVQFKQDFTLPKMKE